MKAPLGTQVRTYEICPESGHWKVLSRALTMTSFRKGDRMPPYGGEAVVWQLRAYL